MQRALLAEGLGTLLLLSVVVGSGIMGESLAGGNVARRAFRRCEGMKGPREFSGWQQI